jgi:hypothetical protein
VPRANAHAHARTHTHDEATTLSRVFVCPEILTGCMDLLGRPLSDAKVVRTVVGFRPVRTKGVRLEVDRTLCAAPVIHNIGHGGSGVTLHWGCALDTARLAQAVLGVTPSKL